MRISLALGLVASLAVALPLRAQTPGPPAPPAQPPATEPAAPVADAAPAEALPGLFDETWNQFQIAGRISSIAGDPARWQRYQDLRDGLLFTNARYRHEWGSTGQLFSLTADNVGYRDQRFTSVFERPGRLVISGLWDQIPQFYSVDTRTPYTSPSPSVLRLDDGTRRAIQNGAATTKAYIPLATQFDLRERRDIGNASVTYSPTTHLDLSTTFQTQRHTGELPWGASFGFSNDVEVALPYDSRTNDLTIGAEWTNQRNMLRVAYDGSWYDDQDETLVWDSPLRADDSSAAPSRGRMSLWPSNQAQTVSVAGYTKLAKRTQVTGMASYGVWTNDEPLQPFTINTALPTLALPRSTTEAEAHVAAANLSLISRPSDDWRMSARLRVYDYNNESPHTSIAEFINYDTAVKTSSTGGPEPYSHSTSTFAADATWTGLTPVALSAGYTLNHNGYDFRTFESTNENVVTLTADAVGLSWASVRGQLELADRNGAGLDESSLVEIGEYPSLRQFDLANRSRKKFTGSVELFPRDSWSISASGGAGKDTYDDSYFGLQDASFAIAGFGVDYAKPSGLGAGGSYNYERYSGTQQSRSASPGEQQLDPNRDWTTDSTERVHYFSIYVTPPRFGPNTEARLSYDYAYSRARYVYGVVPGGPLPPPSQLPPAFNKLQDFRAEVRHRLSRRLAATASYEYEPFRVFDFAMDPSVVDSIVQPSSLVLGYVYRPYTAHTAIVGLMYYW